MAIPESLTTLDISGTYVMNKSLSDDTENILILQGVSWFKRKAIKIGTLTLYIKHYKDDADIEHIDIDQRLTGGIPGTEELRILNWEDHPSSDHIFGPVIGKSRRVKVSDLDNSFLKEGWTQDTITHGLIQSYVESDTAKSGTTWIANQTWGMSEAADSKRRYIRHVKFTGPKGENIEARLVYDYVGPL